MKSLLLTLLLPTLVLAQTTPAPAPPPVNPPVPNPPANRPPNPAPTPIPPELRRLGSVGIGVHDPSTIVPCNGEYYLFTTGQNVPCIHSTDLVHWSRGPSVFNGPLPWVKEAVPRNGGSGFWAPDVIKLKDKYLVFYSASSFGRNTSAIGVASNSTLDPKDPTFKWTDGGMVIQSKENDDFNCIDPAAFLDNDGRLYMTFGSFWSGIKLIELDPNTGLRLSASAPVIPLAHWDSIEAPYLYRHGDYYYLFASYGLCCRGANSTYHTRVGRSKSVSGPYTDKDGVELLYGGGTTVLETEGNFIGPGHAGIITVSDKSYFSCHFYDGTARGASKLAIRPLTWTPDGWPSVGPVADSPPTP